MGRKRKDYFKEMKIGLNHNELVGGILINNVETGEQTVAKPHSNNLPDDKLPFLTDVYFDKYYWPCNYVWDYLETVLTDLELRVAQKLTRMGKMNSNSLEPLNDTIKLADLSKEFNIGINKTSAVFNKLALLGMYLTANIAKHGEPVKQYWVLNPYMGFSGSLIEIRLLFLFTGTTIEKKFMEGCQYYSKSKPKLQHIGNKKYSRSS